MSVLRRKQRYVQRFRRRMAGIEAHLDLRVEVRIEAILTVVPASKPEPKPSELDQVLAKRDAWLAAYGIKMTRVRGQEVLNISDVLQAMKQEIAASVPALPRKREWP